MSTRSPLSPVIANIYMKYFEKMAFRTIPLKPSPEIGR